jgi:transcriptional antiterminator NusG
MNWYVVHVYAGMEKSVHKTLLKRIEASGLSSCFGRILLPSEEVIDNKHGKRSVSERRFFPGYLLIEMVLSDETWHLVKGTSKVSGFVGGDPLNPTPISEKEVDAIFARVKEGIEKPKPKILFEKNEVVRIISGPFMDFVGAIEDVNYEKSRLSVSVVIFGRQTPVEMGFDEVEKTS